jgi:hypothetical protein
MHRWLVFCFTCTTLFANAQIEWKKHLGFSIGSHPYCYIPFIVPSLSSPAHFEVKDSNGTIINSYNAIPTSEAMPGKGPVLPSNIPWSLGINWILHPNQAKNIMIGLNIQYGSMLSRLNSKKDFWTRNVMFDDPSKPGSRFVDGNALGNIVFLTRQHYGLFRIQFDYEHKRKLIQRFGLAFSTYLNLGNFHHVYFEPTSGSEYMYYRYKSDHWSRRTVFVPEVNYETSLFRGERFNLFLCHYFTASLQFEYTNVIMQSGVPRWLTLGGFLVSSQIRFELK